MPNWVGNSMVVTGSKDAIDTFITIVGKPVVQKKPDHTEAAYTVDEVTTSPLSFHNIIPVPNELRDEYYTRADGSAPANNWYEWNVRNWGTKWDAVEPSIVRFGDEEIGVHFDTAWSPPEPVFATMIEMFPSLSFSITCMEEQGWGVEYESAGGRLAEVREWGIPESHADNAAIDRTCVCEYEDDTDYWFDDCPGATAAAEAIAMMEDISESI